MAYNRPKSKPAPKKKPVAKKPVAKKKLSIEDVMFRKKAKPRKA